MTVRTIARSSQDLSRIDVNGAYALVNVGSHAPLPDGATLEPGRLVNIHHQFGNELGASSMEALSIVVSYAGSAASSTAKEAIDATVVSNSANDTGLIQTIAAAIKKDGASTNSGAIAFGAWPTFYRDAGQLTAIYGYRVYGTDGTSGAGGTPGGTGGPFIGYAVDANALNFGLGGVAFDWVGLDIGAYTGTLGNAGSVAAAIRATMPAPTTTGIGVGFYGARNGASPFTMVLQGGTSGQITLQALASSSTWTWTFPTNVAGTAGFQLTDAGANGATSWAATGSRRAWKDPVGTLEPQEALSRILALGVIPTWRYKPGMPSTGDYENVYAGPYAEDAPWLMHFDGGVVAEASGFGHCFAAIQALAARVEALEAA